MKKAGILFALIILLMVNLILAGELRVTQEHPFFVDGVWVQASDLQVGDELMTSSGQKVRIISIEDVSLFAFSKGCQCSLYNQIIDFSLLFC